MATEEQVSANYSGETITCSNCAHKQRTVRPWKCVPRCTNCRQLVVGVYPIGNEGETEMVKIKLALEKASRGERLDRYYAQEGDSPFDCWIGDNTTALMADAAFSVIEAVDDAHACLKREGQIEK